MLGSAPLVRHVGISSERVVQLFLVVSGQL